MNRHLYFISSCSSSSTNVSPRLKVNTEKKLEFVDQCSIILVELNVTTKTAFFSLSRIISFDVKPHYSWTITNFSTWKLHIHFSQHPNLSAFTTFPAEKFTKFWQRNRCMCSGLGAAIDCEIYILSSSLG